MTEADMWEVLGEAATMLDGADCDWRTLQQIEVMLSSLACQLARAATGEMQYSPNGSSARRADSNLRTLQNSLAWVRGHEYVALESELQQQLDTALRSAMGAMGRLSRSQHETRGLSFNDKGSGDAR